MHNLRQKIIESYRIRDIKRALRTIINSKIFIALIFVIVAAISSLLILRLKSAPASSAAPLATINSDRIVINSPYKNYPNNYKGNLHAHTNFGPGVAGSASNDDGAQSVNDVANWYKSNGYDFYALTGHYSPYAPAGSYQDKLKNRMTLTNNPNAEGIVWMGWSLENTLYPNTPSSSLTSGRLHMGMINLKQDNDALPLYQVGTNNFRYANPSYYSTLDVSETSGSIVSRSGKTAQNIVDYVDSNGGIAIINHPYIYTGPSDKPMTYMGKKGKEALNAIKVLDNITAVEINNAGNATNPLDLSELGTDDYRAYQTLSGNETTAKDDYGTFSTGKERVAVSFWDEMLLAGKKIWAVNNDDGHQLVRDGRIERGRGFNIVNSNITKDSLTKDNIIASIKSGNFYASTPFYLGVAQEGTGYKAPSGHYDLKVSVNSSSKTINASTANGSKIRTVIGYQTGAMKETTQNSKSIVYTVNGYEKYIRFEIINSSGREVAWSQPIFITVNPEAPDCPV